MAIHAISESIGLKANGSLQTYQDLTFLLGPPSGARYEALSTIARRSGARFSEIYRLFIEHAFDALEMQSMFDRAFSSALVVELKTNAYFLTEQCWLNRREKLEKFYLSKHDERAEIPAIMVFPPKFILVSGHPITRDIEMHHACFVSAYIGQSFELDWIEINAMAPEKRTLLEAF
ncbi:MAG: hypothetical protein CMP14_06160 [Rickettsiales bacterium]|nr:hypothetical protein [Rickettsiales bacterium]